LNPQFIFHAAHNRLNVEGVNELKQFLITPSAGKRLIAKTLANHPAIRKAVKNGTLVIVAGTTNGYVAEEILKRTTLQLTSRKNTFFAA
jgi:hypothetical protein